MSNSASRFYNSISDVRELPQVRLIEMFVYHLTVELGAELATAKEINACFEACDLLPPANTSARLSAGAKRKPPTYIKNPKGFKLQRHARESAAKQLGAETIVTETSSMLRNLEGLIANPNTKEFLSEALDCFEVGANRGTIVLTWLLTVDHLQSYILKHKLNEFNAVLSSNTDKRVKIDKINEIDDFNEIPEGKFIEFCRIAKIISNDVRKILDQKLQTRNSSAHPSGVKIGKAKVIDFVQDLVANILVKYEV